MATILLLFLVVKNSLCLSYFIVLSYIIRQNSSPYPSFSFSQLCRWPWRRQNIQRRALYA